MVFSFERYKRIAARYLYVRYLYVHILTTHGAQNNNLRSHQSLAHKEKYRGQFDEINTVQSVICVDISKEGMLYKAKNLHANPHGQGLSANLTQDMNQYKKQNIPVTHVHLTTRKFDNEWISICYSGTRVCIEMDCAIGNQKLALLQFALEVGDFVSQSRDNTG
jgi:hypothetical protein